MSPLLKKEIRLLLPAWGLALLLAVVPPLLIQYPQFVIISVWVNGIGALILAVSAFGREFALGTSSLMFAQPVPRGRVFALKGVLLTVALASVLVTFWISHVVHVDAILGEPGRYWKYAEEAGLRKARWHMLGLGIGVMAAILAGGLWTTLIFRQMVASFWISVLVPGILVLLTTWIAPLFHLEDISVIVCAVLLAYATVGLAWAWRLFQNVEDTAFSWGGRTLPFVGELFGKGRARSGSGHGRPFWMLVRQELSLHQAGLMGAAVLLLLHLGSIGIRASGMIARTSNIDKILEPIGLFWLLVPLMVGASVIAEERRLGTLEAHLCLPVSRHRLFLIKSGVASLLGVLLGAGALLLTETLGRKLGVSGMWERKDFGATTSLELALACLALTCIAIYASSLSRSTLQALGIAVFIALMGLFTINVMGGYNLRYFIPTSWIPGVCWTALFLGMAVLSYRNFGYLHCGLRRVLQNVWIISLTLAVVTTLCAGAYHRAWELVTPLEPEHGPARIVGSGQTKIGSMWIGGKLLVLLPDGRLWTSKEHAFRARDGLRYEVPASGGFLATSNWTDLASCGFQAIALRSDGTLWSLFRAEHINKRWKVVEDQPRQIGSEGNWVRVAAGQSHLLVLKEDGTLWGWGGNSYSQVCEEGPDRLTNGPVRIGRDSDWTQVFARRDSSVGVKSDGSSWQWGRFYEFQGQRSGVRYETHNQPVRWDVDLGGVRKLIGEQPFDLLLHQDGTLWAVGQLFYGILGTSTQPHYASEPVEAGGNRLWLDISVTWSEIAGISEDGRLWKETQESRDRDPKTMSQHNDWIAVEGVFGQCIVALAADGTLSCWATDNGRGPLAPSRRPLTSINIFDEPK